MKKSYVKVNSIYHSLKIFRSKGLIALVVAASTLNTMAQSVPKQASQEKASVSTKKILVTGTITDENNLPLIRVSVAELGTKNGAFTNEKGHFHLNVEENAVLLVTYLGMESQKVRIGGKTTFNIVMKESNTAIKEVVVTGIPFTRKVESFTGAYTKITAQELQSAGTQNIFQALKNLEPALNLIDNNINGSDPNKLPEMQIRGSSSFPDLKGEYATKPNQPLFIVDGFEMALEKVGDLPLTRIESVTILKDASAKALYGARAANGVIVIETLKAKTGALRISYSGTVGIEAPDLSSYNLTNAAEKLDLERRLGAYNQKQPVVGLEYESLYYANLKEVQSGVNTDWLAQPLQTGMTNRHMINIEGGEEHWTTGFSLFSNGTQGAMKGSGRNNLGGALNVSYRKDKILFRNQLSLNKANSENSPYGTFSDYAQLNPYWRPYNDDGSVRKVLGVNPTSYQSVVYNPMYNATLNYRSTSEYTDITNNMHLEYAVNNNIKVVGRVGFSNTVNGSDVFIPGSSLKFMSYVGDNLYNRGSYDKTNGKTSMVSGDLNASYNNRWGKHLLYANVATNIREDKSENYAYSATGFPNDKMDNIIFAKQYASYALKPTGGESLTRELGAMALINYSFDERYVADLSLRSGTSSQYGTDNRWGLFWSAGAGWNLHKEKFLNDNKYLNLLKLRGSIGNTGSQNFNAYQAMSLYNYFVDNSYQGMLGTYLNNLNNPGLKWQQRTDYNIGIDAEMMKRLSLRLDIYKGVTNNLLTDITTPPSLGFQTYKANLGQIVNNGYEFRVNYKMFANPAKRQSLNVFVSGAANTNKITKISNSLQATTNTLDNQSRTSNKPLTRFQEGQSLNAIWAVRSNGIDPATGKEIFVKQDGSLTDTWDVNDKVVVGNNLPKMIGTTGANFAYKGFNVAVTGRYRVGGQTYNQTLVDKVENASLSNNVDARAYYNSWKQAGDNVLFRSIGTTNTTTLATSRFVQDLSEFSISSVNLGYDFYSYSFIKKMKLSGLRVALNLNDVYQFSTVKVERGTAYPFARNCSLTLNASF
ncbi:SusC/RagA family TonB-linked outer membrane protein [Solitalea lacus]|uniref:SusC/RagA family TonB-linked outer membrane protein n=1 Tax=Solitalea lacus TaxID=2911172 RepID=UPI001EDA5FDA|nr:SusC/RagA family TonB-linked outer membrane protein [Solitalea lacus]UKJ08577.1 SusC/RagA family TonB-linked outer membrane protein [Solitalea lacus]